jgi:uncharacterized protein with GYD domain
LNLRSLHRELAGWQATPVTPVRPRPNAAKPLPGHWPSGPGRLDASAVLRTLIEDFGGEATLSSLLAGLQRFAAAHEAPVGAAWLRALLADLSSRGAVDVEVMDEVECVARILPDGARAAYQAGPDAL